MNRNSGKTPYRSSASEHSADFRCGPCSILLVNDDGIDSPGLRRLITELGIHMPERSTLTVVAPARQRSWISKASSYRREMALETRREPAAAADPPFLGGIYALDGTPADCAVAGIYHLCPYKPDLVISGINTGANVGDSYILSSGTVGGAAEAALAGIPALAAGLEFGHERTKHLELSSEADDRKHFAAAAKITARIAGIILELLPRLEPAVFNLNMSEGTAPDAPLFPTVPARYSYGSYLELVEGGFVHHGAAKDYSLAPPGTDMAVLREGGISLSLLRLLAENTPAAGDTSTGGDTSPAGGSTAGGGSSVGGAPAALRDREILAEIIAAYGNHGAPQ